MADPIRLLRQAFGVRPRSILWLLLVIVAAAALVWRLVNWRNQPPEIPFAKVVRESIMSSVSTNGKVEPDVWATARAERSGPVGAILIERGKHVEEGAPLVEIDASDAQADLAASQSRIEQARADLAMFDRGGRTADLADISSGIEKAKLELDAAQKDYEILSRLQAKEAATKVEAATARQRVENAQLQIYSFEQKRTALVAAPDKSAALARLHDAETAAKLADQRIKQSTVRAPISGVVYQFDLKRGAYLNAGDIVAYIGKLERVRVNVYVDEPDLGRVTRGLPVSITWDALPGRSWAGVVDKTPTQIEALGSRQVGQVTVRGWDRKANRPINETYTLQDLWKAQNLSQLEKTRRALIAKAYESRTEVVTDQPVHTVAEAKALARSILEKQDKKLIEASGATIGLPDLRAGSVVYISGFGAPPKDVDPSAAIDFEGRYYVTASTHTIQSGGYRTECWSTGHGELKSVVVGCRDYYDARVAAERALGGTRGSPGVRQSRQ